MKNDIPQWLLQEQQDYDAALDRWNKAMDRWEREGQEYDVALERWSWLLADIRDGIVIEDEPPVENATNDPHNIQGVSFR
jgi:hypothetical protein